MVDLAGEAVGRQPLRHGVRIEEGAKNLLRLGGEDTMQTNGIALGHDVIFSITERSISQDLLGLAQSLPQGRLASLRADMGQKKFPTRVRAGSVLGDGRAAAGCTQRHAAGDAHAKHVQPAFVEIEQMRIQQRADDVLNRPTTSPIHAASVPVRVNSRRWLSHIAYSSMTPSSPHCTATASVWLCGLLTILGLTARSVRPHRARIAP